MPDSCVALLRGINVGGKNRLPMKQLLDIAEQRLGLEDCQTYVQSGNLVFRAGLEQRDGLERRLEAEIEADCGFKCAVLVRSAAEWDAIVGDCPFVTEATADPKHVHVFVLTAEPSPDALADLASREFGDDRWHLGLHGLYLRTPNGTGRSKLAGSVERILKVPMTARNWSSVLALQAMLRPAGG
ncbi:DUF1697 domain-containing protein [Hoeflea sp. AS60]|uniref:DUF1697 domain-containing protein n=1 Tax=Hoeflea sp. AS60 TaxID=3135780 RepID=UPI003180668D